MRHTDTRSRLFFVATVDDATTGDSQLVGWAHLTLPGIEYLDHTAELTVGVRSDLRRRGIGSQLSRTALAWAAANGYHKVYQSLPGTNRAAIDFLGNHGWTVEAVRRDHYRIDGEFVDEVMMAVGL
ncbi:GNAT family N-acetyltransferase [Halorussus caseinilyticus]|uniref:GNAT family N-acetyltransferase n=1 Tax=Halorussus caseinilyticus TaxID=3034025 RepID=A0ABD5WM38_9EURY